MATKNRWLGLIVCAAIVCLSRGAGATHISFEPGDVFVSLEQGPVQWHLPDGTLVRVLAPTIPGTGEGMAFDANGYLFVTRWCIDPWCATGNAVEMYDPLGRSWGSAGTGFNCNPHALVFDATGASYVGQAGCNRSILKFVTTEYEPTEFMVDEDNQGAFWIDVAPNNCTVFYTSYGPNVKRFDACAGVQLPDFNLQAVPGGIAHDLRVLPDGGVLVSSGQVVARLDSTGALMRTYSAPEASYWAGLDLAGDGTFWAANYETSNVCRFDLASGQLTTCFNAGAPPHSIVGVRIKR